MGTRKLLVRARVFQARGNETQGERGNEDKLILAKLERPPP